jgi:hypothetical protein
MVKNVPYSARQLLVKYVTMKALVREGYCVCLNDDDPAARAEEMTHVFFKRIKDLPRKT